MTRSSAAQAIGSKTLNIKYCLAVRYASNNRNGQRTHKLNHFQFLRFQLGRLIKSALGKCLLLPRQRNQTAIFEYDKLKVQLRAVELPLSLGLARAGFS